jgi:hypothetical protein
MSISVLLYLLAVVDLYFTLYLRVNSISAHFIKAISFQISVNSSSHLRSCGFKRAGFKPVKPPAMQAIAKICQLSVFAIGRQPLINIQASDM